MGVGIGTVLALCVIAFVYLIRKHPTKAKQILERSCTCMQHTHTCKHACTHANPKFFSLQASFLGVEVRLALKAFWGGADFYTESAAQVNRSPTIIHCLPIFNASNPS